MPALVPSRSAPAAWIGKICRRFCEAGPGKNREHDESAVRKTRQTVDSTRAVVARVATASIWQLGFHNLAAPTSAIRARREAASWAAAEISIQQLQRKLDLSRRPGRVADEAKTGAKHDVRGQSEVDQIENVEKFRAELQLQRFPH